MEVCVDDEDMDEMRQEIHNKITNYFKDLDDTQKSKILFILHNLHILDYDSDSVYNHILKIKDNII
jgi:ABC-type dipeptide/oligopeptide/nickel transport system ATPase subunit